MVSNSIRQRHRDIPAHHRHGPVGEGRVRHRSCVPPQRHEVDREGGYSSSKGASGFHEAGCCQRWLLGGGSGLKSIPLLLVRSPSLASPRQVASAHWYDPMPVE